MAKKRIINVSNRLPVKLSIADGNMHIQASEGGLATAVSSVLSKYKNIWIGWPGEKAPETGREKITSYFTAKGLYPVYLSEDEIRNFYEGFSNDTLWPLFHYFPTYAKYKEEYWESYVAVNRKYADTILKVATAQDVVWIHDYHLMLVPAMVRAAAPDMAIGFFQHIPFPDYEIFRALPWKDKLLSGLLGADIIGFQTEADTHHFLSAVSRILNIPVGKGEINLPGRKVGVQAFPISIDYKRFRELATHETTESNVQRIKHLINTKLALSVDRLDYSKGILERLHAYELFLKNYPEWHQKITLIHLIVPSRDNVGNYKRLKQEMDRLISHINGKYAVLGWQPIHHFYQSFTPHMLSALYKSADIALVTPLRDGMNLVCKEYIAGNVSMNGILMLSEATGAAAELTDAIMINPNNIKCFADKIHEGLVMPAEEKKARMYKMQQTIAMSDVFLWANKFIKKLFDAGDRNKGHLFPVAAPQKGNVVVFTNVPLAS